MKFLEAIRNIFRIPDLRRRVLFTLALLGVYRLGAHIPTPGINTEALAQIFQQYAGTWLGLVDLFSGGNFRQMSIFALGIMPYITASIILQLMTVVWPYLERLKKEGALGQRKITQYTRYLTVFLSAFQGLMIALTLMRTTAGGQAQLVLNPGMGFILMTVLTLTTGTIFIMWLGEQISDRGIGNGMSLLIFAGIVVGLPRAIMELYSTRYLTGQWGLIEFLLLGALMLVVVAVIVYVEGGQRRIPVQYAKRIVGRKMMGGAMSYLPIRVNTGGVIPVIFASSILTFPQTVAAVWPDNPVLKSVSDQLAWGMPLYTLLYIVGILFFCYFYVSIIFNPDEVADNMRKWGGFIPGIRPGRHTSEYLNTVLTRLTFVGGVYLALISIIPEWMIAGIHLNRLPVWLGGAFFENYFPTWILDGLGVQFYFGGTSLLIVVGVAMDTVNQIEAQLTMRHYEGFTTHGRIRGRRS
ncbi:MAG TPA: preprotein translocase subunit SecY [Candidatus Acidoferrales bacterium]